MAQHTVKGIGFRTNGLCATTVDLQRANGTLTIAITLANAAKVTHELQPTETVRQVAPYTIATDC